jgi:hypothetical protein
MAHSRDEFIKVRVSAQEKAEMERVARTNERTLSQQIRFAMMHLAPPTPRLALRTPAIAAGDARKVTGDGN